MFERNQLEHLLDMQDRSFRLLQWLNRQLKNKTIQATAVHDSIGLMDASKEWITRQLNNFPLDLRPKPEEIDEFSYLLSSYLQTSFEIVKGKIQPLGGCHCCCHFCLYLQDSKFLRARKVTNRARETGQKLKEIFLQELITELRLPLIYADLGPFLEKNPDLAYDICLLTYSNELRRRTNHASQGLGVLALWREIAWIGNSPKKAFKITAFDVLSAEDRVRIRLKELCDP